MFHVNKETGEVGKCEAKQGKCPFGTLNEHYTSADAARSAYEKTMSSPKPISKRPPVDANLDQYKSYISQLASPEVYVHPQGKVFIYDDATKISRVFKHGKAAASSGKIEDLRNGRGAWKLADISGVTSAANPAVMDEMQRKSALLAQGLPASSTLDPRKNSPFSFEAVSDGPSYWSRHTAAAILPIDERLNPHDPKIDQHEIQSYWGRHDPTTRKLLEGPVFEIWKDLDSGRYRYVTTSGHHLSGIGSKMFFSHDQTGNRIGNHSVMVGAFEAQPGGAMVGEVPNKSGTVFTYK